MQEESPHACNAGMVTQLVSHWAVWAAPIVCFKAAMFPHLADGAIHDQLRRAVRDGAILVGLQPRLNAQLACQPEVCHLGLEPARVLRRLQQHIAALEVCMEAAGMLTASDKGDSPGKMPAKQLLLRRLPFGEGLQGHCQKSSAGAQRCARPSALTRRRGSQVPHPSCPLAAAACSPPCTTLRECKCAMPRAS